MKYSDIYRHYSTSQPNDAIHQALREVPVDDSDEQYEDRSPLHLACQYGDTEGVKILLERDAEPNTKDANGSTPIHILGRASAGRADEEKLKEIAVMLMEHGANIPRSAKNTTALIECVRNRHFKMAEAIMDSGARGSTTTFVENQKGDVLIAWENEAITTMKSYPDEYEMITPSVSILAQPSVAIVDDNADANGTQEVSREYLNYLYTDDAQRLAAEYGYRPSNESILKEFSDRFDLNVKLYTIKDYGGWNEAYKNYFDDGAMFDEIYGNE